MKSLILLFLVSTSVFATEPCMLREYYAEDGDTDERVSREYIKADDAAECFVSAIIKSEISKKPFIKTVDNTKRYLYVYWEFNDGTIFDSDGYVTRWTRDCVKRSDGRDVFDFVDSDVSSWMSAVNLMYSEECEDLSGY